MYKISYKKGYIVVGGEKKCKQMEIEELNIENKVKYVLFEQLDEDVINKEIKNGMMKSTI